VDGLHRPHVVVDAGLAGLGPLGPHDADPGQAQPRHLGRRRRRCLPLRRRRRRGLAPRACRLAPAAPPAHLVAAAVKHALQVRQGRQGDKLGVDGQEEARSGRLRSHVQRAEPERSEFDLRGQTP
jgi:hypothetical protein